MAEKADKATAIWVIRRLRQAGYQALLAGGCVRDMLLGVRPDDYDVATDATPNQVRRVFRRSLAVGAKFGVIMVLHRDRRGVDRILEVATFRRDSDSTDGRRPDAVTFSSPQEDAQRRDFTINGMFYDPLAENVIDYVGGRDDLKRRIIRTIGNPHERFREDYLRLLRAVRFSVRLGFHIHPATATAIERHAPYLGRISGERIYDEFGKMLSHPTAAAALRQLHKTRLLAQILPELLEPNDELWLAAHQRVDRLPCPDDPLLNFGALLMDLPVETIARIARRWGTSNHFKETMQEFSARRDEWRTAAEAPLCDFKRLMAGEHWHWLRLLWKVREKIETNSPQQSIRIARRAGAIDPAQVAPEPFVTGEDLLKMNLPEGRRLGQILRALYDAQLNEEITTRRAALEQARRFLADEEAGPTKNG
jgi:poly(A) polymerase